MIIEQVAPAGPTAWLAAVGLAHLTKEPLPADKAEAHIIAGSGQWRSRPSRWVETGVVWSLEIDQPAGFADLLAWYDSAIDDDFGCAIEFVARDPWWRTRGKATPAGIGRTLRDALREISGPVDLVAELREISGPVDLVAELRNPTVWTDAVAGWVIDRRWVTLDPDDRQMRRPLVRYALAYVGAVIAQHWPGHMVRRSAIGHLWDGQPGDHPLTEHTAVIWGPSPDERNLRYPAWWGPGEYVTVPAASWEHVVQDVWGGAWPLDVAGVARHAGLSPVTVRSYVRDGIMPPADGQMGQSAWWWSTTIDRWQQERPGVGRPKRMAGAAGRAKSVIPDDEVAVVVDGMVAAGVAKSPEEALRQLVAEALAARAGEIPLEQEPPVGE